MLEWIAEGAKWAGSALGLWNDFNESTAGIRQERIANRNLQFQKDAFDYQKNLNTLQMQREDNAVQRRYADLKAAGINPLLAAGGQAASAAPVRAGAPPQMESYLARQVQGQTMRRMQQQIKNDKAIEKNIAAQTALTNQQVLKETINTLIKGKDFDTYNERLWHQRIGLGTKVSDQVLKGLGGGMLLKGLKLKKGQGLINMKTGELLKER